MSSSVFGSILTLLVCREIEGKRERKGRREGEGGREEVGRGTISLSSLVILLVSTPILLGYGSSLRTMVNLSSSLKNLIYTPTLILRLQSVYSSWTEICTTNSSWHSKESSMYAKHFTILNGGVILKISSNKKYSVYTEKLKGKGACGWSVITSHLVTY